MEKADQMLKENMGRIKHKIVVMSGKGGVGKSTVAVNLAYYFALQGFSVGLLDVDIHGPSAAKMTGVEDKRIVADENGKAYPIEALSNFYVVSLANMLENPDDPVIWRGPAKMGVIKQLLAEISWPELDFLVVDCPPGTGDEPLSVIQLINDVTGTVIVSTPQDIALLDVRKSINFAKKLNLNILGIVENMSGFICPHCGKNSDIFKTGGVDKASADFGIDVLGKIPLDADVVNAGDSGKPYVYHYGESAGGKIMNQIGDAILTKMNGEKNVGEKKMTVSKTELVAIPVESGVVSGHFGHSEKFVFFEVNGKDAKKVNELVPPPHAPGVIPAWLHEQKATTIIVSGIGQSAVNIFNSHGINVIRGVECVGCDEIIKLYVDGKLSDREVSCNHDHHDDCH